MPNYPNIITLMTIESVKILRHALLISDSDAKIIILGQHQVQYVLMNFNRFDNLAIVLLRMSETYQSIIVDSFNVLARKLEINTESDTLGFNCCCAKAGCKYVKSHVDFCQNSGTL